MSFKNQKETLHLIIIILILKTGICIIFLLREILIIVFFLEKRDFSKNAISFLKIWENQVDCFDFLHIAFIIRRNLWVQVDLGSFKQVLSRFLFIFSIG